MSLISRFAHGLRALFNRDATNRKLDDEVRHYLEESIAANIARGMPAAEAERVARASLGSVAAVQEPARSHGRRGTLQSRGLD